MCPTVEAVQHCTYVGALHIRMYSTYIHLQSLPVYMYVCSSTKIGQYWHLPMFVQCIHHAVLGTVNFRLIVPLRKNKNPNWPIKCELYRNLTKYREFQFGFLFYHDGTRNLKSTVHTYIRMYSQYIRRTNRERFRAPTGSVSGHQQGAFQGTNRERFRAPTGSVSGHQQGAFEGTNRERFEGTNRERFEGTNRERFRAPTGSVWGHQQGAFEGTNREHFEGTNRERLRAPTGNILRAPTGSVWGHQQGAFWGHQQVAFWGHLMFWVGD